MWLSFTYRSQYVIFSSIRILLGALSLVLNFIKVFKILWKCAKKSVKQFGKKCRQEAKIRQQKLQEIQKMESHGLPLQRNLNAYFGLQKVMDFQLFDGDFKRNIKIRYQCALAFFDGTRTTSTGLAFCSSVEMDIHRSMIKRKK